MFDMIFCVLLTVTILRKMNSIDKENWEHESNSLIDKIPKQKSKEKKEILKRQDRVQSSHN